MMLPTPSPEAPVVDCVIPARFASQRLPGKPLAMIGDRPLILRVADCARASEAFRTVAVATDDQRIFDTVSAAGFRAVMTRADHVSGTDRVNEAAGVLGADFFVNLQGDEPFVPPPLLQEFARQVVLLDSTSLLTCVTNATMDEMTQPGVVKAVCAANGRALYFSRSPVPYTGRSESPVTGLRHIGIYGFSRASLAAFCALPPGRLEQIEKLEQLRALEAGMAIRCLHVDYRGIGVDTPEDLQRACALVKGTVHDDESSGP